MAPRLEKMGSILEPWVLSGDEGEGEERLKSEMEGLRSLYFERYIQEWRQFLSSLSLQFPGGLLSGLEELTRAPRTPLGRLFEGLAHHTQIGGASEVVQKAAEGLGAKLLTAVLAGREGSVRAAVASGVRERRLGARDVEQSFAGLVDFGYVPRTG